MTAIEKTLGKRAQMIFKALVERHIQEGQPVGSKALAESAGLPLSPATIRSVLADLEAEGLLASPHTSAGRVPTARGYRLFVDSLLTIQPLSPHEIHKAEQQLHFPAQQNMQHLLANASALLSNITSLTGLVTIPRRKRQEFTHVEFLPLSHHRLLVILVLNQTEVQNRIIDCPKKYTPSELQQTANYLNQEFAGVELKQLKRELKRRMKADQQEINQLWQAALNMDTENETQADFVMSGQARLVDFAGQADISRFKELFEAFTQKRDILCLLEHCLEANGVQIYIGEESGYQMFDGCSLVTAPYSASGGQVVGALAVIGPTHMAYHRVIPIVDITAKLLSAALNQEK